MASIESSEGFFSQKLGSANGSFVVGLGGLEFLRIPL